MQKIISLLIIILLLSGCATKDKDEFAEFRNQSAYTIFTNGEKNLAKKDYGTAVKNFEALDAIYPFSAFSEQGQLDSIYTYYMNDDDASALAAVERYIHLYPREKNVDYAYYMRGIVGFNLGLNWLQKSAGVDPSLRDISNLQQSFSAFALLIQYFPNSAYTPDALLRMIYIRNLMARREVLIAEYYMRKGAYVAAANRANYVVQHFQGSPEVKQALIIMEKSYRKLKLNDLANKSRKILNANYTNV